MNQARRGNELVTLHGSIYAIGGADIKTVERYNPLTDEWDFIASTQHEFSLFGATSHQDKIYVLSNEGFEVFDPKFDTWQNLTPLPSRDGVQLVSFNDKLLAVGGGEGINGWKASKTVFEFDIINNSWIHLSDMDAPRKYHRAVVVNF